MVVSGEVEGAPMMEGPKGAVFAGKPGLLPETRITALRFAGRPQPLPARRR
jgi:hypothetical protein